MAKNANIRFENANVAYVSVDTDTHELTGGVMDETTGTFYPVGGGGGGVTLYPITLKFVISGVTPGNNMTVKLLNEDGTFTVSNFKTDQTFTAYVPLRMSGGRADSVPAVACYILPSRWANYTRTITGTSGTATMVNADSGSMRDGAILFKNALEADIENYTITVTFTA